MAFHILFRILDGRQLVIRLLKGKHLFKLFLPYSIRLVGIAVLFLTRRIKLYEISCNLLYGFSYPRLRPLPVLASQPVQLGLLCIRGSVLLDQIHLGGRNIKIAAPGVRDFHIILLNPVHFNLLDSLIDTKAMIFVYHIVPRL